MRCIAVLFLAAASTACSTAPQPRSPRAEAQLRDALAGRVAQTPVDCLHASRSNDMIVVDDNTILFRDGNRLYRNDLAGGSCSGLGMGNTLVTRQIGGQGLCRGDIAHVINPGSGMTLGACVMGDFVPYTAARR